MVMTDERLMTDERERVRMVVDEWLLFLIT